MISKKFLSEYQNNNKSGKMSSEKYVFKNYIEDYNKIMSFSLNLIDIPFKEKVYHLINNIPNKVLCKNPNCKNSVKFRNSTLGYRDYCSNRCIGTDPKIIKRKEEKSIIKFGTKTPAESSLIKNKIISTNNKRYGGNSPMNNKKIQEKSKETLIKNWGVDNPNKSKELIKKRVESFKENIDQYKESYKKTSLERYGVDHPWKSSDIHEKSIDSGRKSKRKNNIKKIQDKLPSGYEIIKFKDESDFGRFVSVINCPNCNDNFEVRNSLLYDRLVRSSTEICTNCNKIGTSSSGLETQLLNFIKENYQGEVISNSREVINPYEIDIYLPEFSLAIEFNGVYWHSEIYKEKNYHINKTNLCEEKGIQLIHVWEDDWVMKQSIIKSMILNKIGKSSIKIYGRNTELREVNDNKLIRNFLDNNHIQGFVGSKIKLGLYHENVLVSLMTFGQLRQSMGSKSSDGKYELIRFCNQLNTSVIGGASKLFKYFIKNYIHNGIVSYSDNSYSNGNLYRVLGFNLSDYKHKLNYYWVIDSVRKHRYNFRKSNLIKLGYGGNKSETEIMYEDVGSYRVWGCGNKKWQYENNI